MEAKWSWTAAKYADSEYQTRRAALASKTFDPDKKGQKKDALSRMWAPFRSAPKPKPMPEATTAPLFGSSPAAPPAPAPMNVDDSPASGPPQQPSASQEVAAAPASASSAFNEDATTPQQRIRTSRQL